LKPVDLFSQVVGSIYFILVQKSKQVIPLFSQAVGYFFFYRVGPGGDKQPVGLILQSFTGLPVSLVGYFPLLPFLCAWPFSTI
jgi:hypothetical protein